MPCRRRRCFNFCFTSARDWNLAKNESDDSGRIASQKKYSVPGREREREKEWKSFAILSLSRARFPWRLCDDNWAAAKGRGFEWMRRILNWSRAATEERREKKNLTCENVKRWFCNFEEIASCGLNKHKSARSGKDSFSFRRNLLQAGQAVGSGYIVKTLEIRYNSEI